MRWAGPQGSGPARPRCQLVGLQHKPLLLPRETLAWGSGKVGRGLGAPGVVGPDLMHLSSFLSLCLANFWRKFFGKNERRMEQLKAMCLTTQRPRSLLFNLGTKCVGPRAGGRPCLPWDSSGQGSPLAGPHLFLGGWRREAQGCWAAGGLALQDGGRWAAELQSSMALGKSSSLDLWTPFPMRAGLTAHVGVSAAICFSLAVWFQEVVVTGGLDDASPSRRAMCC